jgi:hypothetical protein
LLTTTITGLSNGTTYAVRLKAKNTSGAGDYGAAASSKPTANVLYRGAVFGTAARIGAYSLADALDYIAVSSNTQTGDNYFIVLGENQDCPPKSLSYSGKTVGITLMADGGEKTVQLASNGSLFTIGNGITLTLQDNVTLKGSAAMTASLVRVNSGGAFTMNGGTISGNTASLGSGVSVEGGAFTMHDGEISGNTAFYGGGVYVFGNGAFTMHGGEILNITAATKGGGVCVVGSGAFTMNDGIISGNTAYQDRGGVDGGGVYVFNHSEFTMHGGAISGNTAFYGGGVYVGNGSMFMMDNGTILNNTASYIGGGVYVGSDSTFTKAVAGGVITGYGNDTITGNKVVNSSGAIQSSKGHAVYISASKRLEKTVPANKALDSRVVGAEGGWTE